jgi:hypothetical protein
MLNVLIFSEFDFFKGTKIRAKNVGISTLRNFLPGNISLGAKFRQKLNKKLFYSRKEG